MFIDHLPNSFYSFKYVINMSRSSETSYIGKSFISSRAPIKIFSVAINPNPTDHNAEKTSSFFQASRLIRDYLRIKK